MKTFTKFQEEVKRMLIVYNYTEEDVDYINISTKYFVRANGFFELSECPQDTQEKFIHVSWCNKWYVPEGFRVVMKDKSFFLYNTVSDEYYSGWIHLQLPEPSPTEVVV